MLLDLLLLADCAGNDRAEIKSARDDYSTGLILMYNLMLLLLMLSKLLLLLLHRLKRRNGRH